ncbi:MAG TPA: decarboxylase [Bosea sp. (in: a-proteobacteria)]|uniref:decarboxylase n=1 Tax=Bosea sp. (in: a-proteobacteria) TaxID=1871050 RepID=UPI002E0FF7D8|nr:decarboxylase [Bosea sp. (in: a-proteobacteria)]
MNESVQESRSIDHFFSAPSGRTDLWRDLHAAARSWASGTKNRRAVEAALTELGVSEEFHAFPGADLLAALRGLLQNDDANGFLSLAKRISIAIITGNYKHDAKEWQAADLSLAEPVDIVPASAADGVSRPYFEMLTVTPAPLGRWPHIAAEFRRLRRSEDAFVYEAVLVGSLEDAICAAVVNPDIAAVAIYEGFTLRSRHDAPVLRSVLAAQQPLLDQVDEADLALRLAAGLKAIRPELDIYLLSDRRVEKLAGDPRAAMVRRVMYQIEEPLELHLSVLEGIQARFETPFFDNLKRYAQRPIATFHALPIARGKSVFRSPWIRDMGQFYGINLFLAESSATTGGLDSLLEPTGNIKRAQEMAARAFGADHVFFVTNGTSTSNKMVLQALIAPGDIVILDRNCHKSHHYGLVLSGAQPFYVEAFPMTEFSMYGAVPLRTIKKALLDLKAEGRLDRVKMVDLTNCTFDGHIYNTRRVMEECLAIKPDLIFLWDEAWFGFARWSPFLRPRTGMGAAADIEAWAKTPEALAQHERQVAELGASPSLEKLLDTRLVPDPRAIRLRVYQTNSTHKSMSAIRQGSMVLVRDVEFHRVEAQFHEAVFTHASTSPNQQLIASLDVARRQMELEGYGLVMNAIEVALDIRREVNSHPVIAKYFSIVGADGMVPSEYRRSGFVDFLAPGTRWDDQLRSMREDEFCLDPTRMTLVCGTAGFDGTSFKGLLASQYNIQVNKTSRNSVLLQSNINNTRSDVALLISVLLKISESIETRLKQGGDSERKAFNAKVQSLMKDVPDLPNFSHFHETFRQDAGDTTPEGDIRSAFFGAYNEEQCEYVPIDSAECDRRLKDGPDMVSANFVIPYPPGFPIMVPGQVVTHETITFMRKLDVKEIHGYEKARGLKLLKIDRVGGKRSGGQEAARKKPRAT